ADDLGLNLAAPEPGTEPAGRTQPDARADTDVRRELGPNVDEDLDLVGRHQLEHGLAGVEPLTKIGVASRDDAGERRDQLIVGELSLGRADLRCEPPLAGLEALGADGLLLDLLAGDHV